MAIPLPLFLKIQPVILAPKALTSIALPWFKLARLLVKLQFATVVFFESMQIAPPILLEVLFTKLQSYIKPKSLFQYTAPPVKPVLAFIKLDDFKVPLAPNQERKTPYPDIEAFIKLQYSKLPLAPFHKTLPPILDPRPVFSVKLQWLILPPSPSQ